MFLMVVEYGMQVFSQVLLLRCWLAFLFCCPTQFFIKKWAANKTWTVPSEFSGSSVLTGLSSWKFNFHQDWHAICPRLFLQLLLNTSWLLCLGVELILITVLVGDQLARANPATYVYVWMERVCMAENPHQLCLHIWILTGNRTALPPDSACLHCIFMHVTNYHDYPPGFK